MKELYYVRTACGICSYHAHASSSKGSSCARIRKEHNQGIGGLLLFSPETKCTLHIHEYSFGIQSLRPTAAILEADTGGGGGGGGWGL